MTDASVELSEALGRTSSSLIACLKQKEQDAWRRFVHLYGPLVFHWCRQSGLQEADAADVGQDVFRKVTEAIDGFHYGRQGDSFRGWLRAITRTRIIDFTRRRARTATGVGGDDSEAQLFEVVDPRLDDESTEVEDRRIVHRQAVEQVLSGCREETRRAFLRVVVDGDDPADVAEELGMTVNAIYVAKARILRRIREEFAELVD